MLAFLSNLSAFLPFGTLSLGHIFLVEKVKDALLGRPSASLAPLQMKPQITREFFKVFCQKVLWTHHRPSFYMIVTCQKGIQRLILRLQGHGEAKKEGKKKKKRLPLWGIDLSTFRPSDRRPNQ